MPRKSTSTAKKANKSAKREFVTAAEIQRAWREENGAVRAKSPKSAIKSQRSKRDLERRTRRPSKGKIEVLQAKNLKALPWLLHGFSTRKGGVTEEYGGGQLNLGLTPEDRRENVMKNRELLAQAVVGNGAKGKPWPLVNLSQIHSAIIHHVGRDQKVPQTGDGLITNVPGVLIAVKVADCVPVIVADRKRKVVGVFHAGWRGTVQRIVEKGVGEMQLRYGCEPKDLIAAVGPAIGKCCYEIGDEVESEFESQFAYSRELFEDVFDSWSLHQRYPLLFLNQRAPGHGAPALSRHLDLAKANLLQLLAARVPAENIISMEMCTSCRTDLFFSHRKDRVTGRLMAVVGIRGKRKA